MAICCIALGGNVGNTSDIFKTALASLAAEFCHVRSVSSFLRTPAMGIHAGDDFVNAAAVVETDLDPQSLMIRLQQIESELGRTRSIHWGPRCLDLDLLFYDQQIIHAENISIPHPALWYRRFVVEPLAEVAPDFRHPILAESVAQLFQRLKRRPLQIVIAADVVSKAAVKEVEQILQQRFSVDSVELRHLDERHPIDHRVFAAIRQGGRKQDTMSLQRPHESDRSIRVVVDPGHCFDALVETLTDVCSAALG